MTTETATPISSDLYSAYAAGALDPAFALLVETQAALRSDVRNAVTVSEAIAGAALEQTAPVALPDGALDRALAHLDAVEASVEPDLDAVQQAASSLDELLALPEPLRETALLAAGEKGWSFAGPGLRRLSLNISEMAEAELFRIEPGAAVPRHTHEATEFTLVIQGGFSDDTGSFGPGDLAVKGPADTHMPVGDEDGVCIVLAVRLPAGVRLIWLERRSRGEGVRLTRPS
ncbi:MAG: ChrR family anti-sigma-E factor, partial [Hyphomonadaceae bacterium]|nr:ChrR family anti-sigma-E factor [Hyphomonadaceae bacterium]